MAALQDDIAATMSLDEDDIAALDEMCEEADKDDDDKLDYNEFLELVHMMEDEP